MQKVKKSLENCVLEALFRRSSSTFNLETPWNNNLGGSSIKYANKTLITNSSRQLKFLPNLGICDLKYPLGLRIFKINYDLNKYFDLLKDKSCEKIIVFTKLLSNIFKSDSYLVVNQLRSSQTFFGLNIPLNRKKNSCSLLFHFL